jgi:hypothetical protein
VLVDRLLDLSHVERLGVGGSSTVVASALPPIRVWIDRLPLILSVLSISASAPELVPVPMRSMLPVRSSPVLHFLPFDLPHDILISLMCIEMIKQMRQQLILRSLKLFKLSKGILWQIPFFLRRIPHVHKSLKAINIVFFVQFEPPCNKYKQYLWDILQNVNRP